MFIMLRKRTAWYGKFPTQIITTIILSHSHTVFCICSLGLGRFCYTTACPSKPTALCTAVILRGLTLTVLASESWGKLLSVTGANMIEAAVIQHHGRAFEELDNH